MKWVLIFFLSGAVLWADDLTLLDGTVYKNYTIAKVQPAGLQVIHSDGAAFVPFENLPEPLREKYNYDPQKAAEYVKALDKQKEDAARAAEVAADAEKAAKAKKEEDSKKAETERKKEERATSQQKAVDQLKLYYDEFKDLARAETDKMVFRKSDSSERRLQATIWWPGRTIKTKPKNVNFWFWSYDGEGWQFLKLHNVEILADGEHIFPKKIRYDGDVGNSGGCYESIWWDVSAGDFEKMVSAKETKIKIGISVYTFTDETREKFSPLATMIQNLADPK